MRSRLRAVLLRVLPLQRAPRLRPAKLRLRAGAAAIGSVAGARPNQYSGALTTNHSPVLVMPRIDEARRGAGGNVP